MRNTAVDLVETGGADDISRMTGVHRSPRISVPVRSGSSRCSGPRRQVSRCPRPDGQYEFCTCLPRRRRGRGSLAPILVGFAWLKPPDRPVQNDHSWLTCPGH